MLSVEGLSKQYKPASGAAKTGAGDALRDVTFHAEGGQVFGLLGPNGAGKTTLLRILATLLTPTSGTASVAGHDIRRDPEGVRRVVGVVNGGMGLYDRLTGREILEYFASFYDLSPARVRTRIEELDAALDLRGTLDRRAATFSTGMKQKIVIARAVLHDPQVLVLDEAASGLDVFARRALLDFVTAARAPGRLVLYSTHVMSEVEEVCDRVAVVHQGRLLGVDTLGGLKAATGEPTLERAFFELVRRTSGDALHGSVA